MRPIRTSTARPGPSLSEAERRHPVQAAERVLGERHPDGWGAMMFPNTCWDPGRNRYACRARSDYLKPQEPRHPGAP